MIDFAKYSKPIEKQGAEYIDLRIMEMNSEAYSAKDGNMNAVQSVETVAFGTRVFYKGAWGFAFCTEMSDVEKAFSSAWRMAKLNSTKIKERFELKNTSTIKDVVNHQIKQNPIDVSSEEKIKEVLEIDKMLKRENVKSRQSDIGFSVRKSWFFNSSGADIFEPRYTMGIRLSLVGKGKTGLVNSFNRTGKTGGYEIYTGINKTEFCNQIYKKFKNALKAEKAPAGRFPIVIDNGLCGVFFHEAVGHACEADAVLEKSSVFQNMLGKKIAPEHLTLVDTPNVLNEGGHFRYDDEGTPAGETFLITNGKLTSYINSLESASLMNVKPSGNGRAMDPTHMPIPRMTNTVLRPGKFSRDELFEGIKRGIYACGSSGGVVEPINGNFVFNAEEAFMIENGKITKPLRDVSLAGNIMEILPKIEKIANDDIPNFWGGRCGKQEQLAPVGEKTPHIKISEAIIGGKGN